MKGCPVKVDDGSNLASCSTTTLQENGVVPMVCTGVWLKVEAVLGCKVEDTRELLPKGRGGWGTMTC